MKDRIFKRPRGFERVSAIVTKAAGSTAAFITAFFIIIAWILSGPIFGFSDTWQLVINTGTTIITFLMVFLIQRSQNKDSIAIHLKLNELVASHLEANNRLVAVEDFSEDELRILQRYYSHLAALKKQEAPVIESYSIDRAAERHLHKNKHSTKIAKPSAPSPEDS